MNSEQGANSGAIWRRLLAAAFLVLALAQVGLGTIWIVLNLGDIPQYGDTREYALLARTLQDDTYRPEQMRLERPRGIAYPILIAAIDRLPGGHGLVSSRGESDVRGGVYWIQGLQLLACVGSLVYFLHVFLRADRAQLGRSSLQVALFLLLFFDPLIAHYSLTLMTDGLALSAAFVFSAALLECAHRPDRTWAPAIALFATFILLACLRVEKTMVLLVAVAACLALWWLQQRRAREQGSIAPRRFLLISGVVLAATACLQVVNGGARAELPEWPMRDTLIHQRVVFPNVSKVYDELSSETRARLSREDARLHDLNQGRARKVIRQVTGDDARVRHDLLQEIGTLALRRRWAWIVLDVIKDAAENTAATFSFYGRLAVLHWIGSEPFSSDGNQNIHDRLTGAHPKWSRLYLGSSIALLLCATLLALDRALRLHRSGGSWIPSRWLHDWMPVVALVLANAFAFALIADLIVVRFVIFAHAALLAVVYRGALLDLLPRIPRRP